MNRLRSLYEQSLLHFFWREFLVRYRFKYVLPRITEMVLDDIRLDLSDLSLKVRNRLLLGIYEKEERALCQAYLRPEDSVVEIGAAIGFIGLYCQKKIGVEHYAAFEANPATLRILRRNHELNGLTARAWNVALAPEEGQVELDVGSDFWDNSILPSARSGNRLATLKVRGAPLGSLLQISGGRPNVLMIDVEGAEQFLDLDQVPPAVDKMIIELHPKALGAEKMYDLIASLIQKGFCVAREEGGAFAFLKRNPRRGRVRGEAVEVSDALLASPAGG